MANVSDYCRVCGELNSSYYGYHCTCNGRSTMKNKCKSGKCTTKKKKKKVVSKSKNDSYLGNAYANKNGGRSGSHMSW